MREISTPNAPASTSPLSQALVADGVVYVSGQVPKDPETGEFVGDDIAAQTRQTLENVEAVLEAAGASLADVVKATVQIADVEEKPVINEVYGEYLPEPYPARMAIEGVDFQDDFRIEIEVVAHLPDK